jgi:hypothetical protein
MKEVDETTQEIYNEPTKNKFLKLLIMFFGIIFIGMLVVSVIFMFGGFSSNQISQQGLIIGASLSLKENNSVKFKVGEEDHSLDVNSVGRDSVDVVIRSEPIYLTLRINEVREIDLNGDGKNDLRIKLIDIQDGKAILAVKHIENEVCSENWKCSDWGECVKGFQKRECVDFNYCGTYAFKPMEKKECTGTEYAGEAEEEHEQEIWQNQETNTGSPNYQSNQNLSINNSPNVNTTNSFQMNNSPFSVSVNTTTNVITTVNDSTTNLPQDNQENGQSTEIPVRTPILKFTCNKNINSFIASSSTCASFNILCNLTKELTEKGVIEEVLSYYELRGIKDGKCIFYYEYRYMNVYPSPDLYSTSSSTGINIVLTEINKDFEALRGKKFICYYPSQTLIDRINDLKEGIIHDLYGEMDLEHCSEISSSGNSMTLGTSGTTSTNV